MAAYTSYAFADLSNATRPNEGAKMKKKPPTKKAKKKPKKKC